MFLYTVRCFVFVSLVCSRRVRTQSELSGVNAAGEKQGQVNEGYVTEGQTGKADGSAHTSLTCKSLFQIETISHFHRYLVIMYYA